MTVATDQYIINYDNVAGAWGLFLKQTDGNEPEYLGSFDTRAEATAAMEKHRAGWAE